MRIILLSLILTLTCIACGENYFYSNTLDLSDGVWSYDQSFSSDFHSSDSTSLYQIWLDVKHDIDFGYQNMYIEIETIFPNKDTVIDVIPLELKNEKGAWEGDCGRKECQVRFNLIDRTAFQYIGDYSIRIQQYGREEKLPGVYQLGLHIQHLD